MPCQDWCGKPCAFGVDPDELHRRETTGEAGHTYHGEDADPENLIDYCTASCAAHKKRMVPTDYEALVAMLDRAKIAYTGGDGADDGKPIINVEKGYAGFVTCFEFNADGSLKDMGAYE